MLVCKQHKVIGITRLSLPYKLISEIALLWSFAFLFVSCSLAPHRRVQAVLDDVESYINDRPDSALTVLDQIGSTRIRTRKAKARYTLLKGIALDKNYVDDGSFLAEMDTAAEWYALHGSMEDCARAWFYLADQQKDAGEIAEAAVNFSRTLDLAEKRQDWFLSGMAARNLSDIYFSGYDYARSLEYAQRSVTAFKKAEIPAHILFARMKLAIALYNNGYLDECLFLCDSLKKEAVEAGNDGIFADALETAATVYIQKTPPQYDSTLYLLDISAGMFPPSAQNQALYAWALYLKGDKQGANTRIEDAYNLALTRKDSLYVHPWAARIAFDAGDLKRYAALQEMVVDVTDAFARNTVLHSVDRAQVKYHQQQEDRLSQKIQRSRAYLTGGLMIVAVVFFSLVSLAHMRRKRLEEKSLANEVLSEKLALYGATVEDTLDFGFDVLNKLSDAYYHPNTAQRDVFKDIMRNYISDVASRERLSSSIEQNINIIHDDVINKLRKDVPALKDKDIKLFSLYLFGFSYKAISEFFPEFSSINSTYSRVSRLRKTIAESGSEHTSFFLSFLDRHSGKVV